MSSIAHPLAGALIEWFRAHRRDLPWRREPRDPYRVWLSEVMLQQTQVATVIPYFERWLARFPTLRDFAGAPLDDVLKLWEGLGYYSRARNFHRAAQAVVNDFGGQIPSTVAALLKLPGIGRYTAGAIASLAFNQHAPLLDGNVKRVLSRVFAVEQENGEWRIRNSAFRIESFELSTLKSADDVLWQLAETILPLGQAGAFNESLMELGATICTPRAPKCAECPINRWCAAYQAGDPEAFPAKTARKATPHYNVQTAIVVNPAGAVLMGQRPREGLLGGLWEFVSSDFRGTGDEPVADMVFRRTGMHVDDSSAIVLGTVKHGFTHFKMTRHVWLVAAPASNTALCADGYDALRWCAPGEIRSLALTRSDQKILEMYEQHRLSLFAEGR